VREAWEVRHHVQEEDLKVLPPSLIYADRCRRHNTSFRDNCEMGRLDFVSSERRQQETASWDVKREERRKRVFMSRSKASKFSHQALIYPDRC
jgi:hypothetical protein